MTKLIPLLFAASLMGCKGPDGGAAADTGTAASGTLGEGPLQYAPLGLWDKYDFEGFPVQQYIPPDARGVIVLSHGSNLNVSYASKLETVAFLNEMIVEGIGFVASESENRAAGQWTEADNGRIGRLYEHVIDTTDLKPNGALFTVGFSGGGTYSATFAKYALEQNWPITGIASFLASASPARNLGVPIVWSLGENDFGPAEAGQGIYEDVKAQGVPSRLWVIPELLVDERSFLKHETMDEEKSLGVFNDLIAQGFIDETGKRLLDDDEMEASVEWYAANGESFVPSLRSEELMVVWAMHRMNAYHSRKVRDFLLAQM